AGALGAGGTWQPAVVAFRGRCLIHRAELLQLQGAWQDAIGEARHACERLGEPAGQPDAGAAYYQLAELHRLRGEIEQADEAYRLANQGGREPQPGPAPLRPTQGPIEAPESSIRLPLQGTRRPRPRVVVLAAAVEILLAAGDVAAARSAADEVVQLAARFDLPFPRAAAAYATGVVLLAEGKALAALESLRAACAAWRDLD